MTYESANSKPWTVVIWRKFARLRRDSVLPIACLIFFTLFSRIDVIAQTPPKFYLEAFAGSYAPWGTNEFLVIDTLGHVSFWKSDLEIAGGDSVFVTLTSQQQQAIYDTVNAVAFYSLNLKYDSGAEDGSGVSIYVQRGGVAHAVEVRNIAVAAVNRLVK